jgi:hypothetical protein
MCINWNVAACPNSIFNSGNRWRQNGATFNVGRLMWSGERDDRHFGQS